MDYGTFGMWAGLLAGGKIVLPLGYSAASVRSPDMVWWEVGTVPRIIRAFNESEISLTALMILNRCVDRLLPVPEWTTWSMWTSRSWTSGRPSSGLDSRY